MIDEGIIINSIGVILVALGILVSLLYRTIFKAFFDRKERTFYRNK